MVRWRHRENPAQIGEVLGYGSRHVQRMLKLASLAPSLLALLAEGQLDVEQCQVLCLESDPERQVAVYESVKEEWGRTTVNALKIVLRNVKFLSRIHVSHLSGGKFMKPQAELSVKICSVSRKGTEQ